MTLSCSPVLETYSSSTLIRLFEVDAPLIEEDPQLRVPLSFFCKHMFLVLLLFPFFPHCISFRSLVAPSIFSIVFCLRQLPVVQ